jgi:hypothetical protein
VAFWSKLQSRQTLVGRQVSIGVLRFSTYHWLVHFGTALWASLAGYHPDCVAAGFATRTSLAGDLVLLSVGNARFGGFIVRITYRHCANGKVASEGRDHLVGVAVFCFMAHAIAVESRELLNAEALESLAAAGVVSHCDGGWSGLG